METQIINLSIPKPLLKVLDQQAKREVKTRSELLRDAVRAYLSRRNALEEILDYGNKQAKKLRIKPDGVEAIIDEYRQGK